MQVNVWKNKMKFIRIINNLRFTYVWKLAKITFWKKLLKDSN